MTHGSLAPERKIFTDRIVRKTLAGYPTPDVPQTYSIQRILVPGPASALLVNNHK